MAAERETVDRLIAHHLADRIGATFEGGSPASPGPGCSSSSTRPAPTVSCRPRRSGPTTIASTSAPRHAWRAHRRDLSARRQGAREARRGGTGRRRAALRARLRRRFTGKGRGPRKGPPGTAPAWRKKAGSPTPRPKSGKAPTRAHERPKGSAMDHESPRDDRRRAGPVRRDGRGFLGPLPGLRPGRLFGRFLKVVDPCQACGAELHHHRADDLPPYLVIFIVGHLVGYGILTTETRLESADVGAPRGLAGADARPVRSPCCSPSRRCRWAAIRVRHAWFRRRPYARAHRRQGRRAGDRHQGAEHHGSAHLRGA